MKSFGARSIFLVIFCNVLFGSAAPFIKLGYECFGITDSVYSKLMYAGIRFFISGIIVFLIELIKKGQLPRIARGNVRYVLLTAFTYTFLQYIFFYIGLSHTTGALGSVISSSSAFIAVIAAHFIYKDDKMSIRKLLGCALGFSGVCVACLASTDIKSFTLMGEGFILLTAVFFVIGSVANKRATKNNTGATVTAYNLIIGGALLIAAALTGSGGEIKPTPMGVAVLGYLVLVSSLGFTLWSMLLKEHPISSLNSYNFINPVAGTLLSGLVLGESVFTLKYLAALVMVSVGIYIVNYNLAIAKL